MQSNVTDIYAIGDIASFPTNVAPAGMAKSIVNINHQHYKIAQTHGTFKLII
jgi:pyruvate/2-oxoglutarate dehydrogenase complex dihydrolipoamide dehydrogenase (E3) component